MAAAPTRSRLGPIVAIVLVVVLLVAGAGIWYLFFRPAGPAPVALGGPAPAGVPGGSPAAGSGGIAGTWSVDPSVGSFSDFSGSFVGYRVKETLASIGATEAVGRTPAVTGTVTVEGTTITAAQLKADLTGGGRDVGRHGHGRPDAPWRHEVRAGPAPGPAPGRRGHDRRLAPHHLRGLLDRPAPVDDGPVRGGQGRHGAPAPAHEALTCSHAALRLQRLNPSRDAALPVASPPHRERRHPCPSRGPCAA